VHEHDGSEHSSKFLPVTSDSLYKIPHFFARHIFQSPSPIVSMPSANNFLPPGIKMIDLSQAKLAGPKNATVVDVPLPKGTVGIVFGVSWLASLPNKLTVSLLEPSATHRGL
jgi:hypothetical protein